MTEMESGRKAVVSKAIDPRSISVEQEAVVAPTYGRAKPAPRRVRARVAGQGAAWAAAGLAGLWLPWVVGVYQLQLAVQGAVLAILAISIGWLIRQTGLLSFGHAAFYGISGYTTAILVTRTDVSNLSATLLALAVGAVAALVVGMVTVRSPGIAFAMLTLAFGMLGWVAATKLHSVTNGADGFNVLATGDLLGKSTSDLLTPLGAWPVVWVALMLVLGILWLVNLSRFGKRLIGIRDNDERMRFSGYRTYAPRVIAFTLSGAVAGLAGSLSVWTTAFISTDSLYWSTSGVALIVAIIGGVGSLAGPTVAAFAYVAVQSALSGGAHSDLIVGVALIIVVVASPGGASAAVGRAAAALGRLMNRGSRA